MLKSYRIASLAVLAAGGLALTACGGGDREAEAEAPGAEVEVSTNLPESQVSDQQLQNAAEGAAAIASTPQASGTAVVVTPPSTGEAVGPGGTAASGAAAPTAGGAGVAPATPPK